ncbi:hypothetical protein [uncultured Corynebacterium sp.]|uniref:hypothetical protein n=1 Tax=uncultured Corynebacterium sp. TaxID=159447 RepID=UPI002595C8E1|nr:hypothetical protein [uncultured Corynebacterium sp.]
MMPAKLWKIGRIQLTHMSFVFLLLWPVAVGLQTGFTPLEESNWGGVFGLVFTAIAAAVLGWIPAWETAPLRALSLSTRQIRKLKVSVTLVGMLFTQAMLWVIIAAFVPLSTVNGQLMVAVVTLLQLGFLLSEFRDSREERSEVKKKEVKEKGDKRESDAKPWLRRMVKDPAVVTDALQELAGRKMDLQLIRTSLFSLGIVAIFYVLTLIGWPEDFSSFFFPVTMGVIGVQGVILGSVMGDTLNAWLAFGGTRRAWVRELIGKLRWVFAGAFVLFALVVGLQGLVGESHSPENGYPAILDSQVLGSGARFLSTGIAVGAILTFAVAMAVVLNNWLKGWGMLLIVPALFGFSSAALAVLTTWMMLEFGLMAPEESMEFMQRVDWWVVVLAELGVSVVILALGLAILRKTMMSIDMRDKEAVDYFGLRA